MNAQLPLEIKLQVDFTFENFCTNNNLQLATSLEQFLKGQLDTPLIYLCGTAGSGKSHLLQASCQTQPHHFGIYLPLKLLHPLGPEIFENIANYPLVCLDDLEYIAGNKAQEEACFHLYNQIISNRGKIIVSAKASPNLLALVLPDLKSRLTAGLIFQLQELSDQDKVKTLQQYTEKRGFHLSSNIAQFLLNHCSRNLHDLLEIIEILDKASLAAKRRVTLPFVKQTLQI